MKYSRKDKYAKPQTAADVLGIALLKEKASFELYNQLLKDLKNTALATTLQRLCNFENEHIKTIQKMLNNEKLELGLEIKNVVSYSKTEKYSKPYSAMDTLKIALEKEKSSYEFYSLFYNQLFGNTESFALLVMLKKLRNSEKEHIKIVEQLISK